MMINQEKSNLGAMKQSIMFILATYTHLTLPVATYTYLTLHGVR